MTRSGRSSFSMRIPVIASRLPSGLGKIFFPPEPFSVRSAAVGSGASRAFEEERVERLLGICGQLPEHRVAAWFSHVGEAGDGQPENEPQHEEDDGKLDKREAAITSPRS